MDYSYIPLTDPEKEQAGLLARQLHISPVIAEILYRRGVSSLEALREYLYPQLASLPDPFTMLGMKEAVTRVVEARLSGHPLYIHGDYDVDGISSTALLQAFFTEAGIQSFYYIPKRTEEQYGLSEHSLGKLLHKVSASLRPVLITVDCGISSFAEVLFARERFGCDVIITDHHLPAPELPEALAIINPKQPGCTFPFQHLAGVGVAFFFILALRRALVEASIFSKQTMPNLKNYLDLVALGTIADVVPLIDVNRTLVRAGLEVLATRKRTGVSALAESGNVMTAAITAEDVAFRLAPRINACGRLGQPELGVQLLLAQDRRQARELAAELENLNTQRKALENDIMPEIAAACADQAEQGRAALAVYNADCHPGILGILASRMAEQFNRPVILFTDDHMGSEGQVLKGSGRSVAEVNLHEALAQCQDALEQFGGHPMAAGLTIHLNQLEEFARLFHESVRQQMAMPRNQQAQMLVDYHLKAEHLLHHNFFQAVQLMEPCGEGNPEPVFLMQAEPLRQVRTVGNDEHVVFQIRIQGRTLPGVGFNLAQQYSDFSGNESALVFKLRQRYVNGREHTQMQVIEFLPD
ncbi:MAG: single-stranded-DNA-specific exonuclease RecJ [bacterium]|nr:single-stranded-DNA-specific exonuclease RecJ [bacterium]